MATALLVLCPQVAELSTSDSGRAVGTGRPDQIIFQKLLCLRTAPARRPGSRRRKTQVQAAPGSQLITEASTPSSFPSRHPHGSPS